MTLTDAEAASAFRKLGWRVRTTGELAQVAGHFQDAWMLGSRLVVDGKVGPKTSAALAESLGALRAHKGTMSQHFSFSELACKCGGKYASCPRIWVQRELVESLEDIRARFYPGGLSVVSGCRCELHNRAVKGAKDSQHKLGSAADLMGRVPWRAMRDAHLAAGIGYVGVTGLVTHVDRRDESGNNTTGGTTARPTIWIYS